MQEEFLYSLLFLLIGAIGVLSAKEAPKTKGDPFLSKITFYSIGILLLVIGLVLLVKQLF
jgi:hypothetical protein